MLIYLYYLMNHFQHRFDAVSQVASGLAYKVSSAWAEAFCRKCAFGWSQDQVYQFGAVFARVVRGLSPLVKTVFEKRTKPARVWLSTKTKAIAGDALVFLRQALLAWLKLPSALVVARSDESLATWMELTPDATMYIKGANYVYLANWGVGCDYVCVCVCMCCECVIVLM